jgi:hypothetical protein
VREHGFSEVFRDLDSERGHTERRVETGTAVWQPDPDVPPLEFEVPPRFETPARPG